ncbi:MAG: hypothetical protein ACLPX7_06205 [Xanthobacteraceae bacterium]
MRPLPRGVSDVFEPAFATVPDPVPVLDPVVVPGEPLEPLLAVEVFPVELLPAPGVVVVVEPALLFDVVDVEVLPVVLVLEPAVLVEVFDVE